MYTVVVSCLSHTEQDVSNLHPRPILQEETVVYYSIKCVAGETGTAIGFFSQLLVIFHLMFPV